MKISAHLKSINNSITGSMSIGALVEKLQQSSFGLLILFLTIPFLQPIPTGGLSTLLGAIISFLGIQLTLKRKSLWLPAFIRKKKLEEKTSQKIIVGTEKFMKKVEKLVFPRGAWLVDCQRTIGMCIALMAIILMLPIPIPFSNMTCAYPIAFFALALLEQDGLMALFGFLGSLLGIAYHIAVFILGTEVFLAFWHKFFLK